MNINENACNSLIIWSGKLFTKYVHHLSALVYMNILEMSLANPSINYSSPTWTSFIIAKLSV